MINDITIDEKELRKKIKEFMSYMLNEEKSSSTIDGYMRNINRFVDFAKNTLISKSTVLEFKKMMTEKYKTATINAALSALNSFFDFLGLLQLKVKTIKTQREIFYSEDKELTKSDYEKLLLVAKKKKNDRIYYIMQTIASSGIRVSELKFFTVESLKSKVVEVRCKGKNRKVIISDDLYALLKEYVMDNEISSGSIFVTRAGKPIDRTCVWREMCELCKEAGVKKTRVFPHNLRHLFARTYYSYEKDIVRLADLLGHSNVNTTRIYTREAV